GGAGRSNVAAQATATRGRGTTLPAWDTTGGDLCLQARSDSRWRLRVVVAQHPPAVPPAHRPGSGDAVSPDRRDTARTAGPALHGGGFACAGHHVLATGGGTGHRALGPSGSDCTPYKGTGGPRDAARDAPTYPARTGPSTHPGAGVDGHQGLV